MIRIQHRGGALYALQSSGYSEALRSEARRTPGMSWNGPSRSWIGYADAVAVTSKRLQARGAIVQGGIPSNGVSTLPIAEKDLRGYQVEGVRFLVAKAAEGCLLADEMAMGKSVQAIRAARALKVKTVVVCPSFVRGVWADEIKRWWPYAMTAAAFGTKPEPFDTMVRVDRSVMEGKGAKLGEVLAPLKLTDLDVVIIHYDILYAWVPILIEWGAKVLILDELQYCQGGSSRRTKACATLARSCPYRIGLTGTPPLEKTKNLWAAINVLSEGRFGEKPFPYYLRYCDAKQEQVTPTKVVWKFDGSSNLDELNARLVYSATTPWGFMLRRLKSEVRLELPARVRQILELEVPRLAQSASIASAIKSDKLLRQALNVTADGKIPQVVDLVVDHIQAGHKVVVGSYRKSIANCIAEDVAQRIKATIRVCTGDVPQAKRDAMIREKPDLLCCTFDSTGVGINLSFASVGVVAELDYTPTKLIQWEARFGRQAGKNVLIQYCIARGSADELVKRVVLAKLDRFMEAVGKVDDKLRQDLAGIEGPGGVDRLKELYEKLLREDD
jgi:SNF2 domain-containing protein